VCGFLRFPDTKNRDVAIFKIDTGAMTFPKAVPRPLPGHRQGAGASSGRREEEEERAGPSKSAFNKTMIDENEILEGSPRTLPADDSQTRLAVEVAAVIDGQLSLFSKSVSLSPLVPTATTVGTDTFDVISREWNHIDHDAVKLEVDSGIMYNSDTFTIDMSPSSSEQLRMPTRMVFTGAPNETRISHSFTYFDPCQVWKGSGRLIIACGNSGRTNSFATRTGIFPVFGIWTQAKMHDREKIVFGGGVTPLITLQFLDTTLDAYVFEKTTFLEADFAINEI
jgi:hypothetical protein